MLIENASFRYVLWIATILVIVHFLLFTILFFAIASLPFQIQNDAAVIFVVVLFAILLLAVVVFFVIVFISSFFFVFEFIVVIVVEFVGLRRRCVTGRVIFRIVMRRTGCSLIEVGRLKVDKKQGGLKYLSKSQKMNNLRGKHMGAQS